VNQRDDTIAIRSVGGVTTVHGQGGNDVFHVGVTAAANAPDFYARFKAAAAAAANDDLFDALFARTHANGLAAVLNLHGQGDSDVYTINLAGQGIATVNVHDNGAPDDDEEPGAGGMSAQEATDAAQLALKAEKFQQAFRLAKAALAKKPGDGEARMVATIAACGLGQVAKARANLPKERGSYREVSLSRCFKYGINLEE